MHCQVALTPAESKRLIGKAVVQLPVVKQALKEGILAIHPSTTTSFIMKEIIGKWPEGVWVFGVIVPRGTCRNKRLMEIVSKRTPEQLRKPVGHTWIFKQGELQDPMQLESLLKQMKPQDVFIKGANAIDSEGNVGVLVARLDGGTIGKVVASKMAKGFNLIFPVSLEKLIPVSVKKAADEAGILKMDYSTGVPVGLMPAHGTAITELEAINILTGAKATPIASGGVQGGEGSIVLVVKGETEQVKKAIDIVKRVKGTRLPKISLAKCSECHYPPSYATCFYPASQRSKSKYKKYDKSL